MDQPPVTIVYKTIAISPVRIVSLSKSLLSLEFMDCCYTHSARMSRYTVCTVCSLACWPVDRRTSRIACRAVQSAGLSGLHQVRGKGVEWSGVGAVPVDCCLLRSGAWRGRAERGGAIFSHPFVCLMNVHVMSARSRYKNATTW